MGTDIVITYKTLFELLRLEKTRQELQKLDGSFYNDVVDYLKTTRSSMRREDSNISEQENERIQHQLKNAYKLISELYSRREKKIVEISLNKVKAESGIVDTTTLLPHEKEFYIKTTALFRKYREEILSSLLKGKLPNSTGKEEDSNNETNVPKKSKDTEDPSNKLVRFLHSVPKFVGKELEIYGPFEEDDMANLPHEIAELLIQKGRAEEMTTK